MVRDAHLKIWIKPLKETNLDMTRAFLDPKSGLKLEMRAFFNCYDNLFECILKDNFD